MTPERLEELRKVAVPIQGPQWRWMQELIAEIDDLKRRLEQAHAACAAMRAALIHAQGCVENEEGDISLAWKAIDDTNPGQPLLDELATLNAENAALRAWCNEASGNITRLRDAIEAMVNRDIEIRHFSARVFPYPTTPGWYWSFVRGGEYVGWVGPFSTAADAILAGLDDTREAGRLIDDKEHNELPERKD